MSLTGSLNARTEDDHVTFAFTVENRSDETETLSFRDACTADFAVTDAEEECWRWSQGRMFTQALQSTELTPGESVTYEGAWKHPESGTYTAVATLEAENHGCEAHTEISV